MTEKQAYQAVILIVAVIVLSFRIVQALVERKRP